MKVRVIVFLDGRDIVGTVVMPYVPTISEQMAPPTENNEAYAAWRAQAQRDRDALGLTAAHFLGKQWDDAMKEAGEFETATDVQALFHNMSLHYDVTEMVGV